MDQQPFFEERYAPILKSEAPDYLDGLLVVLILSLILTAAQLFFRKKSNEEPQRSLLHILTSVQTIGLLGIVATLYQSFNGSEFWQSVLQYSSIFGIVFIIRQLIYLWIWLCFSRGTNKAKWFGQYLQYWTTFGVTLYLPIALMLLQWTTFHAPLLIVAATYVAFRIIVFIYSLNIFPHLHRYPLHIILYLCTCEIAPLLFASAGVL